MSFGDSAVDAAARWCRELGDAGLPVRAWHELAATGEVLAELRAQVAMATVGWRLMLVGPESDVMQARAVAASGGALDAEITLLVHDETYRRVWCSHCGDTTTAAVAVGDVVACVGCGHSLSVYHHVSRRNACYLGFMADAEELP